MLKFIFCQKAQWSKSDPILGLKELFVDKIFTLPESQWLYLSIEEHYRRPKLSEDRHMYSCLNACSPDFVFQAMIFLWEWAFHAWKDQNNASNQIFS